MGGGKYKIFKPSCIVQRRVIYYCYQNKVTQTTKLLQWTQILNNNNNNNNNNSAAQTQTLGSLTVFSLHTCCSPSPIPSR